MQSRLSRRGFLQTGVGAAASASPIFAQVLERQPPPPPDVPDDLTSLTLAQASSLIRQKAVSPVELTQACLDRIDKYDGGLHSFITVARNQAMTAARAAEAELMIGKWRGPLHGVPIGLKDNIDTAGVRTTGGSQLFEHRIPLNDAEVARRLGDAGAVLLGKQNLTEFAYGGDSSVTYFGTIRNPWNLDRSPGGSSGGPGVAVAADFCFGTLGTDTAGSVRIPAAYCGVVGLKPTYGRVSTRGVMTLSYTLDHVGPLTRTVEDTALMMNVVAGYDPNDPTTAEQPVPDYTAALDRPVTGMRLGIPRTPYYDNLGPEVDTAVKAAIALLTEMTASVRDVALPPGANSAQVWGPEAYTYHESTITKTPEMYQPATRRAVLSGAEVTSIEYAKALRDVAVARQQVRKVFEGVDLLITPTMQQPPGLIDETPIPGYNNCSPFDVYGIPAISIPCGFTALGLPIGLQIAGAPFAEEKVLALAYAYQQATDWHRRRPTLRTNRTNDSGQ